MQLHMSLKNAGFGIENASLGEHLILLSGADFMNGSITGNIAPQSGNAIMWSEKTGAVIECSGFLFKEKEILFFPPKQCTSALNWSSIAWESPIQFVSSLESIVSNISITKTNCTILGSSVLGELSVVVELSNSYIQKTKISTCLTNIKI